MRLLKRRPRPVGPCGNLEPSAPPRWPYACTRPAGHTGPHVADIDGRLVAAWGSM